MRTQTNTNGMRMFRDDMMTIAIVIAGSALLASLNSSYLTGALALFAINAILVLSYRSITTMGGWSFAHVAIMGVGGYSVGLLSKPPFDLPVLLTLVVGGLLAALVAALLAYPVLRTRQYYFFLSTFAAGEALRQCFIQFRGITGGTSGIAFIERPEGLDPASTAQFLAFVLFVLVVVGLFSAVFDASETGLKIKAIGQDEDLSASLGMNAWSLRALAFVLGSFSAGIAGGLLVSYNGIVSPSDFSAELMFKVVASCIVGGTARLRGPIAGLIFLTLIEELFRGVPVFVPLIWGAIVIAVTLFAPGGLEVMIGRILGRSRNANADA
jgi:branched-chain amino acid transport system permease protein